METLFVSDLHLDQARPEKLALFQELLQAASGRVGAFYILGDLFEAWVGDDDLRPPHPQVLAALASAASKGLPIYFMQGNRDFLTGDRFIAVTGCRLVPDPSEIDLDGTRALIMHGDALCTSDVRYQAYRRLANHPLVRMAFLALPLQLRWRLALGWRRHRSNQPSVPVDVEQSSVERTMLGHQVRLLIHGHTHRLARHDFELGGEPACRYVLGDWYREDSVLIHRQGQLQFMSAREYVERVAEGG